MGMPQPGTQEYIDYVNSMRKPGYQYSGSEAMGIIPQDGKTADDIQNDTNIDVPDSWYPKSGASSQSSGSSYSGAAKWAIPAYKEMVGMAPTMASSWGPAWEQNQKVPQLLQEQRAAIPDRVLSSYNPFREYIDPVRNASAVRGMVDSTVGAAAENDMRKALYQDYSNKRYESDLAMTEAEMAHYADTLAQAIQSVAAATGMAELGRESRGTQQSTASSFSENQLAKIDAILNALQ